MRLEDLVVLIVVVLDFGFEKARLLESVLARDQFSVDQLVYDHANGFPEAVFKLSDFEVFRQVNLEFL